ncbi:alkyl hydroperoxide reductase subunit F [Acetobacteraceae bacterium]|nr:alkyl hydroperoxide reductase subunit F [Acetobacteraceae bacterium]
MTQELLSDDIIAQLKAYMDYLVGPVEISASLDDGETSRHLRRLFKVLTEITDKITWHEKGASDRTPSFSLARPGEDARITFAGLPMGHEFTSFILALLQTSGHPPKIEASEVERIRTLGQQDGAKYHFEVWFSQSCQNCPDVVQALNILSVLNPNITNIAIDGADFADEATERGILAVPQVYLNGEKFSSGRSTLEKILNRLDTAGAQVEAKKIGDEKPFDVLVIGGGPAGAVASIYAARKGLRTGLVAERCGGQVMDSGEIENFPSVMLIEGPELAKNLEAQVRHAGVTILNGQKVQNLLPATQKGAFHQVKLENEAILKGRTVIAATGAQWKKLNVPGEEEYRTKGVAYCPHCDGPFFKGEKVSVIGGGNSGVEAAIDLAGICEHVTLLQRGGHLVADEVLQRKLRSLKNVTILFNALTEEVVGNGKNVTGLRYKDRQTGESKTLELKAVFVQIGLLPNTDWVKGALKLTDFNEIEIDSKCRTSVPGIFAAGDVTNVPYKQIIIASGEGAKASLTAFGYLIEE